MNNNQRFYAFIIVWLVMVTMGIVATIAYLNGYQDGQVDALTGKVHYSLVIKADSTRVWERDVRK